MDQDFHLIEKYFKGTLSEEELHIFNEKLQKDSKFEQEFRDMKFVREGAKESARANALNILQNVEANFAKKETTKINVSMRRLVSIAASLIVIATVSYFAISNRTRGTMTGDEVFTAYYEAYPNIVSGIERGENIEINTLSARAYNAYDIKDFSKSANLFAELLNVEKSAENYFYSGITNLEAGNLDVAKNHFNTVMNNFTGLKEQSQWYLAITLFKSGDENEAIANIASLAASKSSYRKDSKKLLADLNLALSDNDNGQLENQTLVPEDPAPTPDGSITDVRQYQTGTVRSMNSGNTYTFWNDYPIYELQTGDFVEYILVKSRGKKNVEMAVILGKIDVE